MGRWEAHGLSGLWYREIYFLQCIEVYRPEPLQTLPANGICSSNCLGQLMLPDMYDIWE